MIEPNNEVVRLLLKRLIEAEREDKGPFPYEDIRWLMTRLESASQDFIPDLDYFHSNILGYVSWGPKILSWSPEKMLEVKRYLSSTFFEKYPQYSFFQIWITEPETSNLYRLLNRTELMRLTLLKLLQHISNNLTLSENLP